MAAHRASTRRSPWLPLACLLLGAAIVSADAWSNIHTSSSSDGSSRSLLQAGTKQARPNCVCTMQWEPVCGKDGVTHGNSCTARCKGVEVAYTGECDGLSAGTTSTLPAPSPQQGSSSSSSSSKPKCACAKIFMPVCSQDKRRSFGNACEARCAGVMTYTTGACPSTSLSARPTADTSSDNGVAACGCSADRKQVCGTNGQTYTNECLAVCAGAKVASQGPCKVARSTRAACKPPCVEYSPVCGSDGRTYTNACSAQCRGVAVAAAGACAAVLTAGSRGKADCPCAATYEPVCGGNGKSYTSACEATCDGVKVSAQGLCPAASGAKPRQATKPSSVGSCVCPMVWKPVCTAAGKTRGNKCEAKCRGETIVREGECPSDASDGELRVTTEAAAKQGSSGSSPPTQLVPSKASLTAESATGAQRKHETETVAAEGVTRSSAGDLAPMKPPRRANCVCVALWAPVCGEDGNTYGNKCEAKCHGMRVAAEGECGTQDGGVSGSISSSAARPGCNVCAKVWDPVCGKDGATYGNECEAVCRGKTAVAYKGACSKAAGGSGSGVSSTDQCVADCAASSTPVCGVDGKRYRSACAAKCHKIDVAYPGDCRGECAACPRQWYPYCINSAQYGPSTFANCCFAKCNGVAIIRQVLHPGTCEDKCVRKCDANLERPLCCKGRTYKNGCFATCAQEDTDSCSLGRCSALTYVDKGLGCLLGPCNVRCTAEYASPVCGSDGVTYPNQCALLCSQSVAIVSQGKCGVCAPNQLPGDFPFCAAGDKAGVSPVCGSDGVTYRNSIAAKAAAVGVTSAGTCAAARTCSDEGEACFVSSDGAAQSSTCCSGFSCQPDAAVQLESAVAVRLLGGSPGVCRRSSATLNA